MQHDEVIWGVINENFCSFKIKTRQQNFCKNEYNVTGFCNRQSCPLANSLYATVKEVNGICYLYMKTIERAHTPSKLWERIKLSKNYAEALKQIDTQLQYSPKFQIYKCKQRLTKLTQMLMKMRRLALKTQLKLVPINKKIERRETKRELKAEIAAKLEQSIEKELLSRLKDGAYGSLYEDIVNINDRAFGNALQEVGAESDKEEEYEREYVVDDELDEEMASGMDDLEDGFMVDNDDEFIEDDEDYDSEEFVEMMNSGGESDKGGSDADNDLKPVSKKPKKKGPRIEIEYEHEPAQHQSLATE